MDESKTLEQVKALLEQEKAQDAKVVLMEIEASESVDYLLLKGKIEHKFQNWGEAINAFNKVLEIDPNNSEAASNLQLIQNILNFWNPDMFNP